MACHAVVLTSFGRINIIRGYWHHRMEMMWISSNIYESDMDYLFWKVFFMICCAFILNKSICMTKMYQLCQDRKCKSTNIILYNYTIYYIPVYFLTAYMYIFIHIYIYTVYIYTQTYTHIYIYILIYIFTKIYILHHMPYFYT